MRGARGRIMKERPERTATGSFSDQRSSSHRQTDIRRSAVGAFVKNATSQPRVLLQLS